MTNSGSKPAPDPAVADAAQRQRALAIDESFIVQAPAGSGKTELLTQRYLRLLAIVEHPEEIYAITFTRKAAAEMRNRILAALDAASGPEPSAAHRRQTWQLARAALAQDAQADWRLRDNPNRLRIQTLDGLSHALARQMPLLSELGATPSPSERIAPHYRSAARATLRQVEDRDLGPHLERLLVHLDNRQAQLEDLLCAMLARREQWLRHALASPDGAALNNAIAAAVEDHLAQLRTACQPAWLERLNRIAEQAAQALGQELPPPALSTDWGHLPTWCLMAQLLLTDKGEPRKRWTVKQGFPAPGESGLDATRKAQRRQAKEEIAELTGALRDDPELLRLWAAVSALPACGPNPDQQAVLASLLQVLLHAASELTLVFRDSGEVDFGEIQMRAQRALGSPEEPTELALTLDYRLRHLLVDEFQDTSSGQYRLLETLTAGWQVGDGRTLFAVGDPMQSVYRFREAEVSHYLKARTEGIGGLRLTPLRLEVNFRSSRTIVDWVNRAFPEILPGRVDIARGAVPYAPAIAFHGTAQTEAVQVHAFDSKDPTAEAQLVVELVQAALAETSAGQIAILARARSHLRGIAQALRSAGLRYQAVEIDPLLERPAVRDLHQLTRALLHPADRLAWLALLRAPWLGLDLDDLLRLSAGPSPCVPDCLGDPGLLATLSSDGRRRVERLRSVLDAQLPARGRRPLRQWVEEIWLQLGGLAVVGETGRDDAQAFLGLLDRLEQARGLHDFAALDEALAGLYANPDQRADGRVQLMTMHKAKGLEFDSVILPGLGRPPRSSSRELLSWLERIDPTGRDQLLMAPIRATGQTSEPISDFLHELNRDKDALETARLLYVAVTRARRRLHLLGHVDADPEKADAELQPTRSSLLYKLWPVVEPHFATRSTSTAPAPAVTAPPLSKPWRLAADWRPSWPADRPLLVPTQDASAASAIIEFDWASDSARHVGTLVHRYLERIARDGLAQWPDERLTELGPRLRLALQNLGVTSDELDPAVAKTLRALRQTLQDETGRWLLAEQREAHCEWPLTVHDEVLRHCVIDRSFVDDTGVRWIIDYKTGEHLGDDRDAFLEREQARYREQLETYGRILRLLEDRPIRLALYFPLFPDWRVWDYDG